MKKDVSGETSETRYLFKTVVQNEKLSLGGGHFNIGILLPYPFFFYGIPEYNIVKLLAEICKNTDSDGRKYPH